MKHKLIHAKVLGSVWLFQSLINKETRNKHSLWVWLEEKMEQFLINFNESFILVCVHEYFKYYSLSSRFHENILLYIFKCLWVMQSNVITGTEGNIFS